MNKRFTPVAFQAEVKYELTREEIEEMIRKQCGLADGVIEWDISNRGKVRGATIKVQRVEIKG